MNSQNAASAIRFGRMSAPRSPGANSSNVTTSANNSVRRADRAGRPGGPDKACATAAATSPRLLCRRIDENLPRPSLPEQPRSKINQIVPPVPPHVRAFGFDERMFDLTRVEQLVKALVRREERVLLPAVDVELLQLLVGRRRVGERVLVFLLDALVEDDRAECADITEHRQ